MQPDDPILNKLEELGIAKLFKVKVYHTKNAQNGCFYPGVYNSTPCRPLSTDIQCCGESVYSYLECLSQCKVGVEICQLD